MKWRTFELPATRSRIAHDFAFAAPCAVENGVTYWISIEYAGGDASNSLTVASDNTAPFEWPGYHKLVSSRGGGWTPIANDLPFVVWGDLS